MDLLVHPVPVKMANLDFDPSGDIILILQPAEDKLARFRVSSQILSLFSPVFKIMLDPNSRFKEGTSIREAAVSGRDLPVEINLEDDDPDALAYILAELHHYRLDPSYTMPRLSCDLLFSMAILLDKYDISNEVRRQLRNCLPDLGLVLFGYESVEKLIENNGHGKSLFITYAFEDRRVFQALSREIILHQKLDASTNHSPKFSLCEHLPGSIEEAMIRNNKDALLSLSLVVRLHYEQYLPKGAALCKHTKPSKDCRITTLGAIIYAYAELGIFFPNLITESVFQGKSLEEIQQLFAKLNFSANFCEIEEACCPSPVAVPPVQHGVLIPWKAQRACGNCSKERKIARDISHEQSCSPAKRFKYELENELNSIKGLNLEDFLPKRKPRSASMEIAIERARRTRRFVEYE